MIVYRMNRIKWLNLKMKLKIEIFRLIIEIIFYNFKIRLLLLVLDNLVGSTHPSVFKINKIIELMNIDRKL
jgi:hypothetical protein